MNCGRGYAITRPQSFNKSMLNLDQIAKGYGANVNKVLKRCNDKRSIHRFHRSGWSNDRGKTMIAEAEIPLWVRIHFRDTYFNIDQDRHEREKNMRKFIRQAKAEGYNFMVRDGSM